MRSVSITFLSAWCVLLFGAPVIAEEPVDGLGKSFDDPFIAQLAGDWALTRRIRGTEVKNTVHAEWVLDHQFLELHMQDVANPPAYEALVLIGYSHADKQYMAHWCDVFGGKYSADGYGRLAGNAIEFEFHYPDGPFFNTFTWDEKAQSWTFRMESVGADGKRVLFAEDTLRRPSQAATGKPDPSTFLLVYKPGPAWLPGKPLKQQPLGDHGKYMLSLYSQGTMKSAGPFMDDSGGAVILNAADQAAATAIAANDPAVTSGVFVYELHPWRPVDWDRRLQKVE
jgi:uncharacterized protein YciI